MTGAAVWRPGAVPGIGLVEDADLLTARSSWKDRTNRVHQMKRNAKGEIYNRVVRFVQLFFWKRNVSPPYLMYFITADHDELIEIHIFSKNCHPSPIFAFKNNMGSQKIKMWKSYQMGS